MPFSVSAIFCFNFSIPEKHFLLKTFYFNLGKQTTKVAQGEIGGIALEGGAREAHPFSSKTAEHSVLCGQVHS